MANDDNHSIYLLIDRFYELGFRDYEEDGKLLTKYTTQIDDATSLLSVSSTYRVLAAILLAYGGNLFLFYGEEVYKIDACMYYKLKKDYGWDATARKLDWDSLDADGKYVTFTFNYQLMMIVSLASNFSLVTLHTPVPIKR